MQTVEFWRKQFPTPIAPVDLPFDRPRPPTASYLREQVHLKPEAKLLATLAAYAQRHEISLPVLFLIAFKSVLFRYSGQESLVVGASIPLGKTGLDAPIPRLLPVRSDWSMDDESPAHVRASRLAQQLRECAEHGEVDLREVRDFAGAEDPVFGRRLFNVACCWNVGTAADSLLTAPDRAEFLAACDVVVSATLAGDPVLTANFDSDLFDPSFARRLLEHLRVVLEGITDKPETPLVRLPMMTPAERTRILTEWNDTAAAYPSDATLPELIDRQAAQSPAAVAVSCADQLMSYRDLIAQAGRIALQLRAQGIGPDSRVGICVERSIAMIAGLLGILKAGGAYVPLDPAHPKERLAFILADARVALVLCDATGRAALGASTVSLLEIELDSPSPPSPDCAVPGPAATPANLAYVLYTSGTTGKPKGVAIEHRALLNTLCSTQREPGLTASDRVLALSPLSFDMAAIEIWLPLISGARVVIASREAAFDGEALIHTLKAEGITVMQATPATWRLLLEQGWPGHPKLRISCGGEALSPDLARKLLARSAELWNLYGPTETTIYSTLARVRDSDRIHIGRPIANTEAYILDARLEPVPIGVPGELCLSGDGLARGYLNLPELTAEKFIPHPFHEGRKLYHTGDRARWRADGNIDYLGRLDDQVKIRGLRIELAEIECVLRKHGRIADAAVVARENPAGEKQLIACVVPRGAGMPSVPELRRHLGTELPEYMIPAAFVALSALPLTSSGKVDRKRLPTRESANLLAAAREDDRPRNPIEARLAQVWADVLRLPRVGVHDNFFELGGDSILVTRALARAREAGLEFTARQVFQLPTIARLAAAIASPASGPRSESKGRSSVTARRRLLGLKLRGNKPAIAGESAPVLSEPAREIIPKAPRDQPLRASFAQEQMWLFVHMAPDQPVYNVPTLYRLRGPLHLPALEASLGEIVRRHETLRTRVDWSAAEALQIVQPWKPFRIPVIDLSDLEAERRDSEVKRLALQHTYEPFPIDSGMMLRARLYRLGANDHVLLMNLHHIATDAWSLANLWRELTTLYEEFQRGMPSSLPPLSIQYADFAQWQRARFGGDEVERLLRFWRAEIEGASAMRLPSDRPRKARPSYAGATALFVLPPDVVQALEVCALREQATVFMIVLAAFNALQYRLSGQDEFVVGTAVAGRTHTALEPLIGCFINMLAVRADLRGEPTFSELVQRTRERMLAAFEHQELPFDKLVADPRVRKDSASGEVYTTALVAHNTPPAAPRLANLVVEVLPKPAALARLDLLVTLEPHDSAMQLEAEYRTDLFDESTVLRWMRHFETLLRAATATPSARISQLPLLTASERDEVLVAWNATATSTPATRTLSDLLSAQTARTPDAVALVFPGGELTYRELDAQSRVLADHLRAQGVGPEVLVGLYLDRSPHMLVGLFGIMRAGGAYLPLDPAQPTVRNAAILEDAQVLALVTRRDLEPALPPFAGCVVWIDEVIPSLNFGVSPGGGRTPHQPKPELQTSIPIGNLSPSHPGEAEARAENLAYVIYTSGSTGTPKGVLIEHRSVVNYVLALSRECDLRPGDRVLQFASISFDASVEEIHATLSAGATLVLRTDEMLANARALLEACRQLRITCLLLPTAYWHTLTREMETDRLSLPDSVRLVIVGGDRAQPECLRSWRRLAGKSVRLLNTYGPTETTVAVAMADLSTADAGDDGREVPIGRPVANTRIHLLDTQGQPVPIGVPGELHVGGVQLARGYHRRPELTAEKFIPDPFGPPGGGERLYRTGDLGRYRPDGTIEFVGRIDHQVKIRGFRVEPGEIEAALVRHPKVKETAVVAHERSPGEPRLVAYFVPRDEDSPDPAGLRRHLASSLPDYMVPAAFVRLDRLPITTSGKVDRARLPAPDALPIMPTTAFVAPATEVERRLADIWRSLLQVDRVGRHDDFFELGGHSLLAMRLSSRLGQSFGTTVPLSALFAARTVEAVAALIEKTSPLTCQPQHHAPAKGEVEETLI